MSSHFPLHKPAPLHGLGRAAVMAVVLAGATGLAAAQPAGDQPALQGAPLGVAVSGLFPGGGTPPPPNPVDSQFDGNPKAIADGARLFTWYNCSGCHFYGGGGIGPALMDTTWIYGGSLDQIFASIYQGRPNGMPSWGRKIPDKEIWEIAAYVRSLSSPTSSRSPSEMMPKVPNQPIAPPPGPTPQTSGPAAENK